MKIRHFAWVLLRLPTETFVSTHDLSLSCMMHKISSRLSFTGFTALYLVGPTFSITCDIRKLYEFSESDSTRFLHPVSQCLSPNMWLQGVFWHYEDVFVDFWVCHLVDDGFIVLDRLTKHNALWIWAAWLYIFIYLFYYWSNGAALV